MSTIINHKLLTAYKMNTLAINITTGILFLSMVGIPLGSAGLFFYFTYYQQTFNIIFYFAGFIAGGFFCSVTTLLLSNKNVNEQDARLFDWLEEVKKS